MKNERTSGPEGLPIQLIKSAPEKLYEVLAYILSLFLRGEMLPSEWKTAYT